MHSPIARSPAKATGRFYTPATTARFVTRLAVDTRSRTVLDPACGNGVFLVEAASRLRSLHCDDDSALTGIDLDEEACAMALSTVTETAPLARTRIVNRDFFAVAPKDVGQVELLLGNPPFVRYQAFRGRTRERALKRAADAGVTLSRLSNAWAPFVVHSMSFLTRGGRMGLILPAELLHARYARPVLSWILEQFRRVRILTFDVPLFPSLEVQAIVVLAEGAGSRCDDFRIQRVRNSSKEGRWTTTGQWTATSLQEVNGIVGRATVPEYYLPPALRSIFRKVSRSGSVRRVGEILSIDIGYVTGDHDFFHLTRKSARAWEIPREFCVRSIRNGRGINGSIFTEADWERQRDMEASCYLFNVPPYTRGKRLRRIQPYLAEGIRRGVNRRYQCRARDPWYSVRNAQIPDGFVTSMTSGLARLIVNDALATASNSLHIVSRQAGVDRSAFRAIAASWYSSYTAVSTIMEGHVLGGGLRKLEPSEAERVSVFVPSSSQISNALSELLPEIDKSLRRSKHFDVFSLVDELLLADLAGLTSREVAKLQEFAVARTAAAKN